MRVGALKRKFIMGAVALVIAMLCGGVITLTTGTNASANGESAAIKLSFATAENLRFALFAPPAAAHVTTASQRPVVPPLQNDGTS